MLEMTTGKKISFKKFTAFATDPRVVSSWCLFEAEDLKRMHGERKLIIVEAYDPALKETLGAIAFFVFPPIVANSDWNTIKRFAYSFKRDLVSACMCNARFSIGFLVASLSDEIAQFLITDVYEKMKVLGINSFVTSDQSLTSLGFKPVFTRNKETVYVLSSEDLGK